MSSRCVNKPVDCSLSTGLPVLTEQYGRKGRTKEKIQSCSDSSGTILYLRALQGHSGRNLIDPSLQDNVIILDGFLRVRLSRRLCNQIYIPSSIQD